MLNTEAHPFPRFDASKKRFKTGWTRIPRDEKGELVLKTETETETKKGAQTKTGEREGSETAHSV